MPDPANVSSPPNRDDKVGGNTANCPSKAIGIFDYTSISSDVAEDARAAAARIRHRMVANIGEIGRELCAVKKRMPHGTFVRWVKAELGINPRSAENYMNAALFLEGKSESISHLPSTAIYALAAPSASQSIVDRVVAELDDGVALSSKQIVDRLGEGRKAARLPRPELEDEPPTATASQDGAVVSAGPAGEPGLAAPHPAATSDPEPDRDAKASAAARLLRSCLDSSAVATLRDLMRGTDWARVDQQFAAPARVAQVEPRHSAAHSEKDTLQRAAKLFGSRREGVQRDDQASQRQAEDPNVAPR